MVTIMSDYKKVKLRSKIKTITAKKKIDLVTYMCTKDLQGLDSDHGASPLYVALEKKKNRKKEKFSIYKQFTEDNLI